MENSCGRAARGDDVGRERFAVRMLLMVFQRARGLDEDDLTVQLTLRDQPCRRCLAYIRIVIVSENLI